MQLSSRNPHRLVNDDGFSMFLVIMVLFVSTMFVAAGFAAANGDLPLSGNWRDRKTAYAAAEAGLNFYQYHLDQDNDYWLKCTNVKAPNLTEPSPVNDAWDGTGPVQPDGTIKDPRAWRKLPGSEARYTIELLPAPGKNKCVENDQESMIDPATGTFRIRVTGQAYDGSQVKRSIVASFRRKSFLDFLWFTHFETTDPKNYPAGSGPGQATWAANNCPFMRASRNAGCSEINFVTGDWMHGPMHSDDNFLICGTPKFGRDDPASTDVIEVSGASPSQGWVANTSASCPGVEDPTVYPDDTIDSGVAPITLPTTNSSLKSLAKGIYSFTGKTTIVLKGDTMDVTNAAAGLNATNEPMPANGVIYVDNQASPACVPTPPLNTDYSPTKDVGCGNLFVGGHSAHSLTLAAKNDVIVTGTSNGAGRNKGLLRDDDAVMLGLVADNFVRVEHKVSGGVNVDAPADFEIDAAILALSHSFTVDNFTAGAHLGNLTIDGAIAQLYRGPVGQSGATGPGYLKDYWYDDRLKYQTPPYFLQPVAASWHVMRRNEQVPAR
jgi:hypothetical protein